MKRAAAMTVKVIRNNSAPSATRQATTTALKPTSSSDRRGDPFSWGGVQVTSQVKVTF